MCSCNQLRKFVAKVRPVGRMSLEPCTLKAQKGSKILKTIENSSCDISGSAVIVYTLILSVHKENKNNIFIKQFLLLPVSLRHAFRRVPRCMRVMLQVQVPAFWCKERNVEYILIHCAHKFECHYWKVEAFRNSNNTKDQVKSHWVLRGMVCKSLQCSADSIASTDINISKTTSTAGASWNGFPLLSSYNAMRQMEWCKAHHHWTLEQWEHFC